MALEEGVPVVVSDGGVPYLVCRAGETFAVSFYCASQMLLLGDFEQMVWNQVLRMAHLHDLVPVGAVMVHSEPAPTPREEALTEGRPFTVHDVPGGPLLPTLGGQVMVTGEVMIGAVL